MRLFLVMSMFALFALCAVPVLAQTAPTLLTIYNGDFAVARTTVDLDLHAGTNDVLTTQVTRALEPDSVILRDPSGRATFKVAEQNYDASVITQQSLLKKFEGQTLDFSIGRMSDGSTPTVKGKIIRAGEPNRGEQPLVELEGKLLFQLPGTPQFPAGTDGLLLKPTLKWKIESAKPVHFPAELAYITRGFTWQATYNVVAPESTDTPAGDRAEITGWATMQNTSGTDFPQARIKLMAGDVAKIRDLQQFNTLGGPALYSAGAVSVYNPVTQKAFDDFHLYDLNRTVSLLDGETKQVEFLSAKDVLIKRLYQYDGAATNLNFNPNYFNQDAGYGQGDNTSVSIRQELKNSEANHLGQPLPAGRMRLYRRDSGGQMEFVGESLIKHTPVEDTVSIVTGNAFDLKGKRTQTRFYTQNQTGNRFTDENFAIKLTNAKKQPVTVIVVEHFYRGQNWTLRDPSVPFREVDSHTVEFPVEVPASGEATLTYQVHYTW